MDDPNLDEVFPTLEGASTGYRLGAGAALFGFLNAYYHSSLKKMDQGNHFSAVVADPEGFFFENRPRAEVWIASKKFRRHGGYARKIEATFDDAWGEMSTLNERRLTMKERRDVVTGFHDMNRACKHFWQVMWDDYKAKPDSN